MGNDYNFAGLNAGEGTIRSCINDPHGECDLLVRVHEARPSTPTVLVSRSDDYASLALNQAPPQRRAAEVRCTT